MTSGKQDNSAGKSSGKSAKGGDVRRTPRDSVDLARRPGPGERDDAERPGAPLDPEEQSGGRSMEEEMLIQANDDDAGGLPNQQVPNRGRQKQNKGRDVPQGRYPLPEK